VREFKLDLLGEARLQEGSIGLMMVVAVPEVHIRPDSMGSHHVFRDEGLPLTITVVGVEHDSLRGGLCQHMELQGSIAYLSLLRTPLIVPVEVVDLEHHRLGEHDVIHPSEPNRYSVFIGNEVRLHGLLSSDLGISGTQFGNVGDHIDFQLTRQ
jgi:hypothetical protein